MMSKLRLSFLGAAVCALSYANASALHASTIIKLNLGNVGPDLSMNGAGVLGTTSDGVAGTTGDQNTNVEYTGFLQPLPDIPTSIASFTLSNVLASGSASIDSSGLVSQSFSGGTFSLYDAANALLLSGSLGESKLLGTPGPPGVGAVITTSVASVTGGGLVPFIVTDSLGLSFTLSDVNGGAGFTFSAGSALDPFFADSSASISGDPTPLAGIFPSRGLSS